MDCLRELPAGATERLNNALELARRARVGRVARTHQLICAIWRAERSRTYFLHMFDFIIQYHEFQCISSIDTTSSSNLFHGETPRTRASCSCIHTRILYF